MFNSNPGGDILDFRNDVLRSFLETFHFKDSNPNEAMASFEASVFRAVSEFDIESFIAKHPGSSLWRSDERLSQVFGNSIAGRVRGHIADSLCAGSVEFLTELFPVCVNFEEQGWDGWAATLGLIHNSPYHTGIEPTGLDGVEELTALGLLDVSDTVGKTGVPFVKFSTKGFRTYNTLFAISPRPGVKPVRAYILR